MLKQNLCRSGFTANSIHGDKSQFDRERSLKDFKDGYISILVATDVASRGLDIPNVQYVVIYDLPSCIDQYVHKIGRTGRIGNSGTAMVLVDDLCKPVLNDLETLLHEAKQVVPDWLKNRGAECRQSSFGQNRYTSGGRNRGGYAGNGYEDSCNYAEKFNRMSLEKDTWKEGTRGGGGDWGNGGDRRKENVRSNDAPWGETKEETGGMGEDPWAEQHNVVCQEYNKEWENSASAWD